jgi:hypothetical protein
MSVFAGCEPILRLRIFTRGESLSGFQVIRWWERRRLAFNAIVGATGIVTCALCIIVASISSKLVGQPIGWPDPPMAALIGILVYGIAANVCYTSGWIAELVIGILWKNRVGPFGEMAFLAGVLFSIGVTLTPVVFVVFASLVALVFR